MSVSNILLSTGPNAGKINPALIVGGGAGVVDSVTASAGIHIDNNDLENPIVQIGTGQAGDLIVGTATPFVGAVLHQGANGTYLGVNNAGVLGYSVPPTQGIPFNQQGQMLYAGAGPGFADTLLNVGNANQILGVNAGVPAWIDAGGSGTITATAPLTEFAVGGASNLAIDFTARGDLVAGLGAPVGGNPVAGTTIQLGAQGAVLTATPNDVGGAGLTWVVPTPVTGATIQRVTAAGTTTIAAPTVQDEQLTIITEQTSANTYVYEAGKVHPSSTFAIAGSFVNNISGVFTLVVYGVENNPSGFGVGQIWFYRPNVLSAKDGVWSLQFFSQTGTILAGCNTNIDTTLLGEYGAFDMAFGGGFTEISSYTTGTPVVVLTTLLNFFYLSNALVASDPGFAGYYINPFPKSAGMIGVPVNCPGAANIKFIIYSNDSILVNTPSHPAPSPGITYNNFAMVAKPSTYPLPFPVIVPFSGGDAFLLANGAGPVTDGFFLGSGAEENTIYYSLNWDGAGNLGVVGEYTSAVANGNAVQYPTPYTGSVKQFATFEFDPSVSFNGFQVAVQPSVPINGNFPAPQTIRNNYDPATGITLAGDFLIGNVGGVCLATPTGQIIPVQQGTVGDPTNGIAIDGGAYVSTHGYDDTIVGLFNGYLAKFGNTMTLNWFIPRIAAGDPLAWVGFNVNYTRPTPFQGYFKNSGGQTTLQFTPSRMRYALPSGTSGLAEFAILESQYSTLTLIGDRTTPPYEWDLIGFTGKIAFS